MHAHRAVHRAPLGWATWVLACWIGAAALTGVGAAIDARAERLPAPIGQLGALRPSGHEAPVPPAVVALPVSVEAPTVSLSASLVGVGQTDGGALAVPPFGTAGWYDQSARPGAVGSAVLAGHVDSRKGPDVFYGLSRLRPGDPILVHRADGTVVRFQVDGLEESPKDALPTARVFDATSVPSLRLITCGGTFDRSTGHYRANVIVYAHLIDAAP